MDESLVVNIRKLLTAISATVQIIQLKQFEEYETADDQEPMDESP